MKQILGIILALSTTLAFSAPFNPYLSVNNNTKGTTIIVAYQTEQGSGQLTVPPGVTTSMPEFPNGNRVKNVNFVLVGGTLADEKTCGFTFDTYYNSITMKMDTTMVNSDGEQVAVSCVSQAS